ncbi:hypothetical protein QM012_003019 [Aureobasidium pullulans]|uniref:Uncharacterized protein n=1 Tax=Aureobasidium pullulans TaxID=5580 RepID=A0ABR0TAF7_AURPU
MVQDQERAVDQALSRLGNVATSIANIQKQTDLLINDPGLKKIMLEAATISPDVGLATTVAQKLDRFSKTEMIQSVNPDVQYITTYIQQQRDIIRQQQETISALQEKAHNVDPAAIAQQCCEEVIKSLTANNAPFGKGGILDQIGSATSEIHHATVGPQSSLSKAQTDLAKMTAPVFIHNPLQDIKTSVNQQQNNISSIRDATVGSNRTGVDHARRPSNSLDEILDAVTTKDTDGNTTTMGQQMGDVIGAVVKRSPDGSVTNICDLLSDVHSEIVGKD